MNDASVTDQPMDYPPTEPENDPFAPTNAEEASPGSGSPPAPASEAVHEESDAVWSPPSEGSQPVVPPAAPERVFYTLDPRFIRAEQVGDLIFAAILFTGAAVWLAVRWWMHGIDLFFWILAIASVVVVGTTLWFGIFWPYKTFRRTRWSIDQQGLEIHKGVLWRHRIVVPMSRVQHADVSQGPLQRAFDLGTLTVHTAGTSNASVDLSGLNHDVAVQLRDDIVRTRSNRNGA